MQACATRLLRVRRFVRRQAVWTEWMATQLTRTAVVPFAAAEAAPAEQQQQQQQLQLMQQQLLQQQQQQQQRRKTLLGVGAATAPMDTLEGRIAAADAIVATSKRAAEASPDASPVVGQQPQTAGGALVVLPPSLSEIGARPPKPRKRHG